MLNLKNEFPIFKNASKILHGKEYPLCFLDTAATSQKPQCVIDAMTHGMTHIYGSVHRGAYTLSYEASEAYENARAKVAEFIGPNVEPEQIIFTKNATEGLNILANGLSKLCLDNQSRIVTSVLEHHANLLPWQRAAAEYKCEIGYIDLNPHTLTLDSSTFDHQIQKHTKILSIAHMGNVLGQINPIKDLIQKAKAVGAFVVLDCAQSMGVLDMNPLDLGVDAFVFSGHKLYGPTGIGVLVLKPHLGHKLEPLIVGGGMVSKVDLQGSSYAAPPQKFEAGTPAFIEALGLATSLQWINSIGRTKIYDHSCQLASLFIQGIKNIPNIEIFSPQTGKETIISFHHTKLHSHDLATAMDRYNVALRAGHHCAWPLIHALNVQSLLRASFGAYCTEGDVAQAIEALKQSVNDLRALM